MRHSASPSTAGESSAPWHPSRAATVSIGAAFIAIMATAAVAELSARKADSAINPVCEPWDAAASAAISRLVADTSDAAARQLSDQVFRLRRARKNCRIGWVNLACQDYRALIGDAAGIGRATECLSAVVAGARADARP